MKNLMNKKYFYLIYALIISLISFGLWAFAGSYSYVVLIVLCAAILVFTNDMIYGIPFLLNIIFVNGNTVKTEDVSIAIYIGAALFFISLIYFIVRNKMKFRFNTFGLVMLLLALSAFIPIFWTKVDSIALYIVYFNWFVYFIIYIFFSNSIQKNITNEFSISMESFGLLLSLECLFSIIRIKQSGGSLDDIYSLGWGICNEAGIMILVAIPFCIYRIYKNIKSKEVFIDFMFLVVMILGIWCTKSRGAEGFLLILLGLCALVLLLYHKKYKITLIIAGVGILVVGLFCILKWDFVVSHLDSLVDDNDRFKLYQTGLNALNKSPLYWILGTGMPFAFDFKDEFIVCHSTIYETLTTMGIVGLGIMLVHFTQKYYMVIHNKGIFNKLMLAGFIVVDLYGLIDNTYHMYYFMVPLVMILTTLELHNKEAIK